MYRQLDVYDVLVEAVGETCPDCPDPGTCQAQRECLEHTEELLATVYPAWDAVDA